MSAARAHLISMPWIAALGFTLACSGQSERPAQSGSASYAIQTYGSLGRAMSDGDTEPKVSLKTMHGDQSLVGLGALSGFRGELLLTDGQIWMGYPKDDGTSYAKELGAEEEVAAFAVTARVTHWQGLPIAENVKFSDLEDAVKKLATDAGLDPERPFPFVIDGALVDLKFHVVDGRPFTPHTPLNYDALMAAAPKTVRATTPGLIVGFYSKDDAPEFIERGSHLHMHVLIRDEKLMGHVDHVELPSGITFRVPVPG